MWTLCSLLILQFKLGTLFFSFFIGLCDNVQRESFVPFQLRPELSAITEFFRLTFLSSLSQFWRWSEVYLHFFFSRFCSLIFVFHFDFSFFDNFFNLVTWNTCISVVCLYFVFCRILVCGEMQFLFLGFPLLYGVDFHVLILSTLFVEQLLFYSSFVFVAGHGLILR